MKSFFKGKQIFLKLHISSFLSIFLLSGYIFSYILFGNFFFIPYDFLDIYIPHTHMISKLINGDIDHLNYFLSGNFKWYHLDKIFFPINSLHLFFDVKAFIIIEDILQKFTAFFSFYVFSKSMIKNKLYSSISALLYSTIIYLTFTNGIGLSFLPYFLYLLNKNKEFKIKHYFCFLLVGLNTSIIFELLSIGLLLPLSFFVFNNRNYKNYILFILSVSLPCLISNFNMIYSVLYGVENHRVLMISDNEIILKNYLIQTIKDFFFKFDFFSYYGLFNIPLLFLLILILFFNIINLRDNSKKLFLFLLLIIFFKSIGEYTLNKNLSDYLGIIPFSRVGKIFPFIICLFVILFFLNNKNLKLNNIICFTIFISVVFAQVKYPGSQIISISLKNSIGKNNLILLKNNILNLDLYSAAKIIMSKSTYSKLPNLKEVKQSNHIYENYYNFKIFKNVKKIVKDKKIMSIGIDPFIPYMNGIKIIDGYHPIYPKEYKAIFEKIISKELDSNKTFSDYFRNWGNRVYIFYTDKNNIMIDFDQAKQVGADFVISPFYLNNKKLLKIKVINNANIFYHQFPDICYSCIKSDNLYIYKIL